MKFFVVRLLFCGVLFQLAGCGVFFGDEGMFRSRANDYLKTGSIKEIDLPAGMTSTNLTPIYAIPPVVVADEFGDPYTIVEYEIPLPEALNTNRNAVGVKLQKLDDERWIFIKAPPAQVWPRTQNFLSEYGMRVAKSDPSTGVIETDWVTFRDDESMRSRFKLLLEKGIHADTTEIHVLQIEFATANISTAPVVWPLRSVNQEREDWMIDNLAQELAKNIDNSSASLLGLNVGGDLKAEYVKINGEPALRIHLSPERSWGTLLYSARQEAFRSWDASEEQGIIYLDYSEDMLKKPGFFRKLAFWNRPYIIPEKAAYPLDEILSHLSAKPEVKTLFQDIPNIAFDTALENSTGYLLVVQHKSGYSDIFLRDYRGRLLPLADAKLKLRMLRKNLI